MFCIFLFIYRKSSLSLTMISRLIVSINRSNPVCDAEDITSLAIDCYKLYPDVVVGIEISGNPLIGKFEDFIPSLNKARAAGLKVPFTLLYITMLPYTYPFCMLTMHCIISVVYYA